MGRWRPTACGDGPTLALPPPPDRREPDSAWRGPGCHSDAPSPLESGSAHGHPSSWTGTEISSIRLWQCGRALPRGDPGLLHSRGCEAAQVWGWMGVETPRQNLPSGDCPSSALLRSKGSAGLGRGRLPHTVLGAAEGGAAAGVQDRQTPPSRPGRAATPLGPDEGANADNRKAGPAGEARTELPLSRGTLCGRIGPAGGHFPDTRQRRRQPHPKFSTPHIALPQKELRVGESGGSLPTKTRLSVDNGPCPHQAHCPVPGTKATSLTWAWLTELHKRVENRESMGPQAKAPGFPAPGLAPPRLPGPSRRPAAPTPLTRIPSPRTRLSWALHGDGIRRAWSL